MTSAEITKRGRKVLTLVRRAEKKLAAGKSYAAWTEARNADREFDMLVIALGETVGDTLTRCREAYFKKLEATT